MKCPGCGRDGVEGGVFCAYCGHTLAPVVASSPPRPSKSVGPADKRFLMMTVMVVAVTMIGTVILSPLLMSSELEETVIVIDPYSHYAVRLEFYGLGILEYTYSQVSGSQMLLLELNQGDYEDFIAGEDYDHGGFGMISPGGGGSSSETGPIWIRYLVFVNDNPSPAAVEFGYRAFPIASILVTGPLFAASLLIVLLTVVVSKRRPSTR